MHRDGLTDHEWQQLAPLLPQPTSTRGRPRRDDRLLVEGMVWIARTGAPWRDLPARYGPWQTVYDRFTTYRRAGVWAQVLQTLQGLADQRGKLDWSVCCIDGSVVRAHVHAAGARKRPARADEKGGPRSRRKRKRWAAAAAGSRPSFTSSARGRASRSRSR
jgi:transposase